MIWIIQSRALSDHCGFTTVHDNSLTHKGKAPLPTIRRKTECPPAPGILGRFHAPTGLRWWRRGGRGVTAVELVTIIVLLVIIAAIAIPNLSPVVLSYRLRGAAWQLAGDLRLARQRAVTIRKRFRICVNNCAIAVPAGSYSVERDDGTPSSMRWVNEQGVVTRLQEGVTVSLNQTVTFNVSGQAAAGTFTLVNLIGMYEVRVHPAGRVRVCRGVCPEE